MLTLRSSPASPFGRKVRIALEALGLADRVAVVSADTNDPADALRQDNPLGKIPTLVLEDGSSLYNSRVIVEYLDELAGGGRVIPRGPARFEALRWQALADGLMDAALVQIYETRWREPERRDERWLAYQADKVSRTLRHAEEGQPAIAAEPTIGAIALACALGYLDLRFSGTWREGHPGLVAWLDRFAAEVPSFETTRMPT